MSQAGTTDHATKSTAFETVLGVQFRDRSLLTTALTHRSLAFEQGIEEHNERLEFLGDAVLGLAVTDLIYKWYPEYPEGELAKLRAAVVNMGCLAQAAHELGLGSAVLLGKGEEVSGGRSKSSILADAMEAVLGAVYLDAGIAETAALIERIFASYIREHAEAGVVGDFKTNLQELVIQDNRAVPEYRLSSSGPDHDRRFHAEVYVAGSLLGSGRGKSKKEAEQAAAEIALQAVRRSVGANARAS